MKFITNNICEFEILNNKYFKFANINIIVSVFFKHDKYYKNFDIYIKGLKNVLKFADSKFTKDTEFIYNIY